MAHRTRELAVRLALGASPRRLVARLLGDAATWTLLGPAGGLAGAAVLARYLESLFFRIEPQMLTFAAVAAVFATVTLAASAVPAFRAARVDPMLALRSE